MKDDFTPIREQPIRENLDDERASVTHRFVIGGHKGYVTVGLYADGRPGEVFLKMHKQGSTVSGFADAWAIQVSIALQYGIPLDRVLGKHVSARFEPLGIVQGHATIKEASSVLDYVARWMLAKFAKRKADGDGPVRPPPAPPIEKGRMG